MAKGGKKDGGGFWGAIRSAAGMDPTGWAQSVSEDIAKRAIGTLGVADHAEVDTLKTFLTNVVRDTFASLQKDNGLEFHNLKHLSKKARERIAEALVRTSEGVVTAHNGVGLAFVSSGQIDAIHITAARTSDFRTTRQEGYDGSSEGQVLKLVAAVFYGDATTAEQKTAALKATNVVLGEAAGRPLTDADLADREKFTTLMIRRLTAKYSDRTNITKAFLSDVKAGPELTRENPLKTYTPLRESVRDTIAIEATYASIAYAGRTRLKGDFTLAHSEGGMLTAKNEDVAELRDVIAEPGTIKVDMGSRITFTVPTTAISREDALLYSGATKSPGSEGFAAHKAEMTAKRGALAGKLKDAVTIAIPGDKGRPLLAEHFAADVAPASNRRQAIFIRMIAVEARNKDGSLIAGPAIVGDTIRRANLPRDLKDAADGKEAAAEKPKAKAGDERPHAGAGGGDGDRDGAGGDARGGAGAPASRGDGRVAGAPPGGGVHADPDLAAADAAALPLRAIGGAGSARPRDGRGAGATRDGGAGGAAGSRAGDADSATGLSELAAHIRTQCHSDPSLRGLLTEINRVLVADTIPNERKVGTLIHTLTTNGESFAHTSDWGTATNFGLLYALTLDAAAAHPGKAQNLKALFSDIERAPTAYAAFHAQQEEQRLRDAATEVGRRAAQKAYDEARGVPAPSLAAAPSAPPVRDSSVAADPHALAGTPSVEPQQPRFDARTGHPVYPHLLSSAASAPPGMSSYVVWPQGNGGNRGAGGPGSAPSVVPPLDTKVAAAAAAAAQKPRPGSSPADDTASPPASDRSTAGVGGATAAAPHPPHHATRRVSVGSAGEAAATAGGDVPAPSTTQDIVGGGAPHSARGQAPALPPPSLEPAPTTAAALPPPPPATRGASDGSTEAAPGTVTPPPQGQGGAAAAAAASASPASRSAFGPQPAQQHQSAPGQGNGLPSAPAPLIAHPPAGHGVGDATPPPGVARRGARANAAAAVFTQVWRPSDPARSADALAALAGSGAEAAAAIAGTHGGGAALIATRLQLNVNGAAAPAPAPAAVVVTAGAPPTRPVSPPKGPAIGGGS